jgi:transposase InsO family protein
MIPALLHQLDRAKQTTGLPWRRLCDDALPYATVMRWRQRQRDGQPLWQCPGPKKTTPLNAAEFYPRFRQLHHGPHRTPGTGALYEQFADALSRRQLAGLVQDERLAQLATMKRIDWLWAGLAWACDATEYGADGQLIIPVQDLASRYRFAPLLTERLDGGQIAAHLEQLFRQHGPPLCLKRDNGSPFNHHAVDDLLARFRVLPLNNPPYWPRYNGAMEKSIRDFKAALEQRLQTTPPVSPEMTPAAELTAHHLNHQPRRCLHGRTACAVFHDDAHRRRWSQRQRTTIFRLLLQQFGATVEKAANGHHPDPATLWRLTVESWLRCQGLIVVRQNPNVSTTFTKTWSQN